MKFIKNHPEMKFVPKGWGWERWIANKKEYCGKLLFFAKGRRCSFHYHKLKDETFYVQSGSVRVIYLDETVENIERLLKERGQDAVIGASDKVTLNKGDNFYVPAGRVHMIVALEDTELFEFSTEHFDEDSYRIFKGD